jgi:type IV pilus assembly protein PilC
MLQNYSYRARNKNNQVVAGVVQAASIEAARKILGRNELTPITVTMPRSFTEYIPFFNKVSFKEKSFFARQLSTMIEAGLTLSQALRLLIRQTKKGKFRSVLEAILNDLQDGFSFSTALAKFPDIFDGIFINVVRSGEATGKLEIVLTQLANNMEKDVKVRGKIKGALVYPSFIIMVMIGVAIIMITQVIPQLKDVFTSSGKQLPLSTQFLLKLSDFFVTKWYVVVVLIPIAIIALRAFLRSQIGIELVSKWSLKTPFVGKIIEQSSMARFGRLLGILLSSGVPLLEALRLINDSFPNRLYKRAVTDVAAQVERGVPMSVPINENPIFPIMVGQMVSVGEQTGKMDEVMSRLAGYYEEEVDTKVGAISTLIEPMVIILLGIGVAFLVTSILLPIYEISTSVS